MATNLELLHEAARRGILPAEKQPLYDEAIRRGLIPQAEQRPMNRAEQQLPGVSAVLDLTNPEDEGLAATGITPGTAGHFANRHIQRERRHGRELDERQQAAIFDIYKTVAGRTDTTSRNFGAEATRQERAVRRDTLGGRVIDAGAAFNERMAGVGLNALGIFAPGTANELREDVSAVYGTDPNSVAASAGGLAAEAVKMATVNRVAGPLGMASFFGTQGVGGVRMEADQLRGQGKQVSAADEWKTALATGGVEAVSGFVGGKIFEQMGRVFTALPGLRQAAGNPGIARQLVSLLGLGLAEGTEEAVTQLVTNKINQGIDPQQAVTEGVVEAFATGLILSPLGGAGSAEAGGRTQQQQQEQQQEQQRPVTAQGVAPQMSPQATVTINGETAQGTNTAVQEAAAQSTQQPESELDAIYREFAAGQQKTTEQPTETEETPEGQFSAQDMLDYIKVKNTGEFDEEAHRQLLGDESYELREIPVDQIGEPRGRAGIVADRVQQYAGQDAESAPPVVLGNDNRPIDGKHRVAAAIRRGDATIRAFVPVSSKLGTKVAEVSAKAKAEPVKVSVTREQLTKAFADLRARDPQAAKSTYYGQLIERAKAATPETATKLLAEINAAFPGTTRKPPKQQQPATTPQQQGPKASEEPATKSGRPVEFLDASGNKARGSYVNPRQDGGHWVKDAAGNTVAVDSDKLRVIPDSELPPGQKLGLPKIPKAAREWSFDKLKRWAKKAGYKVDKAQNLDSLRKRIVAQRHDSLIDLRRPPKRSRGWSFKKLRFWAEKNGYDMAGLTTRREVLLSMQKQRKAQLATARSRPAQTPAQINAALAKASAAARAAITQHATPVQGTQHKKHLPTLLEEFITPISSRIRDLSPRVFGRLMNMEFNTGVARETLKRERTPDAEKIAAALGGKESAKYKEADLAAKNGDFDKVRSLLGGDTAAFDAFTQMFDTLRKNMVANGVKIGELKNYWPRYITDFKAFDAIFGNNKGRFQEAWDLAVKAKGKPLTADEKVEIANSVLAGFGPRKPGSYGPSNARERSIEQLTPEQNEHYVDFLEAAFRYIDSATYAAERSKFLGRNATPDKLADTIGQIVQEEVDGGHLDKEQQAELTHLLHVRFTADMATLSKPARVAKQMMYMVSLGQFRNAINQVLDLATTASEHGVGPTLKGVRAAAKSSVADTWLGKALGINREGWARMMESIGLHDHGEEFRDVGRIAKATDKILNITQFKRLDRIGKETRINAAKLAFQKAAREGGEAFRRIERDFAPVFGDRWQQVVDDLKAGRQTLLVDELLMLDVAKVQPINQSQMPERYLTANYGRLGYSMKTFMLNQMDFVRRDIVRKIAKPETRREGLERLGAFVVLTTLVGLGKEFLQDLIRGKKLDADSIPDKSLNSLLGVVGLSRYTLETGWSKSPAEAFQNLIMPPVTPAKNLWRDVTSAGDGSGLRSVQNIPILGDLLYHRWGKGATLDEEQRKSEYRKNLKKLRQEAALARASGDADTAVRLLTVYNERRKEGPGDGRKRPLKFNELRVTGEEE